MTLVEFLLARIADDEAVTRRQIEDNTDGRASWEGRDPLDGCPPIMRAAIEAEIAEDEANGPYFAQVVTAERYLIECEAKRQIVQADPRYGNPWNGCGDDCESREHDWVLRNLALPYADHPDYRAEWRP